MVLHTVDKSCLQELSRLSLHLFIQWSFDIFYSNRKQSFYTFAQQIMDLKQLHSNFPNVFSASFCLFERQSYRERDGQREILHLSCIPPTASVAAGGPGQCREPGSSSSSPTWKQRSKHLCHPLLLFQAFSRELELKERSRDSNQRPHEMPESWEAALHITLAPVPHFF